MPQLRLECSDNLGEFDSKAVFSELHRILSTIADINSCKSALISHSDYHLANGESYRAFIYLKIGLKSGRSEESKNTIGRLCLSYLQAYFKPLLQKKQLLAVPTVEIYDFQHYYDS